MDMTAPTPAAAYDPAAHAPADYAAARTLMVDGQVRPNKVTDPRIIGAMRKLPRERFLPPALAPLAYVDEDVKLPGGRALMEPMVIARLLQLAAPKPGETALVVAAGVGYGAALLAACGIAVTALEEDEALLGLAQPALAEFAPDVRLVRGPLAEGWKAAAPYDLILIDGAVEFVPDAIVRQLKRPPTQIMGRLVTVLCAGGRICHGAIGEPVPTGGAAGGRDGGGPDGVAMRFQPVFDCATPVLPALRKPVGFVF